MENAMVKGPPLLLVRSDAKMRAGCCSVLVVLLLLGAGHQVEAARSCGGIHCAPTIVSPQTSPCRGSLKAYRVSSGGYSVYSIIMQFPAFSQSIFGSFRQHPS